jgi:hypothetical protein
MSNDSWISIMKLHFPKTPNTVKTDATAWLREMIAEVPDLKQDDIPDAIRLGAKQVDASEVIPTPLMLVSWIRRVKWERRQIDKKLSFDAEKDDEKFEVHEQIVAWLAREFKGVGSVEVGDRYIEILDGDRLVPTDEYMVEGVWKLYGKEAFDHEGRPRRLTRYAQTRARRRVQGVVGGLDSEGRPQ